MAKRNRARTSVKRKKRAVRKSPRPTGRPKAKAAASQSRGKWVYGFGDGRAEGTASMRNLLGGKGAGLAEMANLKLPVPPGFTITTDVCTYYYGHNKQYPKDLRDQVEKALAQVGRIAGRKFGDASNPLLVSVRSGARTSMPGMMDTILNLGLNSQTVKGLASAAGERFSLDCRRRFLQMYGDVVLNLGKEEFEHALTEKRRARGVKSDAELTAEDLQDVVKTYEGIIREKTGKPFPEDPQEQLWGAIGAVFKSWDNKRAREYRRLHRIPHDWG